MQEVRLEQIVGLRIKEALPKRRKKHRYYSENIKGGKKNAYWQTDLLAFTLENVVKFSMLLSVDTHSRYITCLKAFKNATVLEVIAALEKAFIKEGRPVAIVTDNGSQFCARVDEQRHAFKEFLASKNICHLRIPPGKPQKTGIVERAVQNVKVEALRPFTSTAITAVQKRLYRWRNWYNFHHRHMGIGNKCPAELFQPWHHRYGRSFLTDLLGKDFTVSTM
ncbi:MAG: DDE-type integrase/transposase/recombinase [Candidatus Odinarchaeota archaeon]